jgi:hypothetical protein
MFCTFVLNAEFPHLSIIQNAVALQWRDGIWQVSANAEVCHVLSDHKGERENTQNAQTSEPVTKSKV